jgi:hypothetical protein
MRVGGKSQSAERLSRDWRPGAGAGKIDKKIGSENGKIGSPMRAGKSRAETETWGAIGKTMNENHETRTRTEENKIWAADEVRTPALRCGWRRPRTKLRQKKPKANRKHLRSWRGTKQDAKPMSPLKSNKIHATTEVTVLPASFDYWERKSSSWHTNPYLRSAYEIWRTDKEPHPSRVLFIGPSKRLKD